MVYGGGYLWLIGGVGFVVEGKGGGQEPHLIDYTIIENFLR